MRPFVLLVCIAFAGCVRYQSKLVTEAELDPQTKSLASVQGKYDELLLTFEAPEDVGRYGPYHDYGFWPGRMYKGAGPLPAGYWVYVEPVWYVWQRRVEPTATPPLPQ